MYRKLISVLAALVMALSLTVALNPAPAQAGTPRVSCSNKQAQAYAVSSVGGKAMSVLVNVGYKSCKVRSGGDFARPTWYRATTNVEGTRMACSDGGSGLANPGHYETRFTVAFYAKGRHVFTLKKFSTPCSNDTTVTTGTKKISARKSKVLPYTYSSNGIPVYTVKAEVDWRGSSRDKVIGARGTLWR